MDSDRLIQKYCNVSREESEKIRETSKYPMFSDSLHETRVRILHESRENEKIKGRRSVIVGPLVQVLSVKFLPKEIDHEAPLTIYGRICVEVSSTSSKKPVVLDLYNRRCDDAEVVRPSGSITLVDLDCSISRPCICMPLHNTKLEVNVYAGDNSSVTRSISICSAEDLTDFEKVKVEYVRIKLGVLALQYIATPFGVYGEVRVQFIRKLDDENRRPIKVKGTIVAKYGHTYGGDSLESCTLFERQCNDFQLVEFDKSIKDLKLSRCWLSLPVYSSLILDLDLLEFASERKILEEIVEVRVKSQGESYAEFIVDDDMLIRVCVAWFEPTPEGICRESMEAEDEASDEEMSLEGTSSENSDDEQISEACVPTKRRRLWSIRSHRSKPFSASAVEIFSISIFRENFQALQVYGFVEVKSHACTFYAFKREAEDAFGLSEHCKIIPVLDGCRVYDDTKLKLKIDLKDVDNRFHIQGYEVLGNQALEFGTLSLNKQLCSVVLGENGFAAIHYSIFPEAVQAGVGVSCTPKGHVDSVFPKVCGSIVAQYNNFDYTSRYNKDNYRIVLFQRNPEAPAQTGTGGLIALSRSMVVVPLNSSLVIDVNLRIGADQVLLGSTEFEIGRDDMKLENNDYSVHILIKWMEVAS